MHTHKHKNVFLLTVNHTRKISKRSIKKLFVFPPCELAKVDEIRTRQGMKEEAGCGHRRNGMRNESRTIGRRGKKEEEG